MSRAIICGGRRFDRGPFIWATLDRLHADESFSLVITGAAPGADTLADRWAEARGIDRIVIPANWKGRGHGAGPYRNGQMIAVGRPDLVVAFPGTNGTANMIAQAVAAGIRVVEALP